jgi:hypothetical protein
MEAESVVGTYNNSNAFYSILVPFGGSASGKIGGSFLGEIKKTIFFQSLREFLPTLLFPTLGWGFYRCFL